MKATDVRLTGVERAIDGLKKSGSDPGLPKRIADIEKSVAALSASVAASIKELQTAIKEVQTALGTKKDVKTPEQIEAKIQAQMQAQIKAQMDATLKEARASAKTYVAEAEKTIVDTRIKALEARLIAVESRR